MKQKSYSKINNCFRGITILAISAFIFSSEGHTSVRDVKYRTYFGQCPSRTAGSLTLQLMKNFEKNQSLKDVKAEILNQKLNEKHFISDYQIKYDPLKKFLTFKFDCPKPLLKAQIYKKEGLESYEAVLVETGELYDPTYEVLLRSEKKLTEPLPYLALPVNFMETDLQKRISNLMQRLPDSFRKKIAEIIVDEKEQLTMILSVKNHPSSAFIGKESWENKVNKLQRIVKYMESKRKVPAIINLTNSEKVVVKFSDKF